jgi:hypothetical protein
LDAATKRPARLAPDLAHLFVPAIKD